MTKPDVSMPVSIGDTLSQAMRLLARKFGGSAADHVGVEGRAGVPANPTETQQ
jgi:hypothetical protein